ncbi:MAG: CYTH domain-containing protein [Verrucomicrobia bacterium]|jgi:adenylate cyclase|nr:CYTH domain-containing protein [Verrucomicrobiota bacterium]
MGTEIERKFLVDPNGSWRLSEKKRVCQQGYISTKAACSMRVRLMGDRGFLTMKTKREGIQRDEFEYEIPVQDAEYMLSHYCDPSIVQKTRHYLHFEGMLWEIDVFEGNNAGLILAEVELESVDQEISLPDWVTKEVSGDHRYFNAMLAKFPFKDWSR